ncbi:unnamed protein product [Dracunculus medinensis]|uniref:Nudix hydrolase domain-containing protein n=1 Tax=Dracunculus medinensis TaxID=318479 RepID=A0A158Q3C3_DRAME|nr:unnamed protein product [Dracunculus medinensis]
MDDEKEGIANMKMKNIPNEVNYGITYVGAAIVLRDNNGILELLMVQEAKRWYIPAGRIKPEETIMEGVLRELFEESGFHGEIKEFLSLQVQGADWYRFVFYCDIIGGERKKVPDGESLSADWISIDDIKARNIDLRFLRSADFLCLLNEGVRYRQLRDGGYGGPQFLPGFKDVPGMFIELLITRISSSKIEIIVHRRVIDASQLNSIPNALPSVEFGFEYSLSSVISKCFQSSTVDYKDDTFRAENHLRKEI